MGKLVVIDDDMDMLKTIANLLTKDGHVVLTYENTSKIPPKVLTQADLILLDVMMPEEDGVAFCQRIRSSISCPLIFLSAKNHEADIVAGLSAGGDDYLAKPFKIGELRARVNAHLRRETRDSSLQVVNVSGVMLNLSTKEITYNDYTFLLTKTEYLICEFLLNHVGQVFSKRVIFEKVFGFEKESDESAIVEHIKNIRAKLRVCKIDPIETVWGMGYKWTE